jgi:mono/diheme cytochrome c family protein
MHPPAKLNTKHIRQAAKFAGLACLLFPLTACEEASIPADQRITGGNPETGRAVIATVECGICHRIPGIRGANGIVGPPLDEFGLRQFIAGMHPNQPATLVRWVMNAPSIAPNTGMPDLDLTDTQARHVAAYLYTLR